MGSYYYALASLPYLRFEGDQYPELDEFLDTVASWASAKERELIEAVSLEPVQTSHPVLLRFYEQEMGLRNELVRQRAAALERDGQSYIQRSNSGDDFTAVSGLAEQARAALQAENPLKSDEMLDRIRWSFLEDLEVGHFYDLSQMIIYYLKLQIVLRRKSLTKPSGRDAFDGHYEAVHQQMQQSQNIHGEQA